MRFLPSKKLTLVAVSAVIVLAVLYVVFNIENFKNTPVVFERQNGITAGGVEYSKDTDGDKLADWEEALWKTDPENPDTDGDGTVDGEEIRLNRDPLKKSPGDTLQSKPAVQGSTAETNGGGAETVTGALAQELFAQYLQQKSASGGTISEEEKQALVESVMKQVKEESTAKVHLLSEIKTTSDNGVVRLTKYGNDLAKTIVSHTSSVKENELIIVGQAVEKKDEKLLNKIPPIETMYRNLIANLLLLEAPSSLAKTHLDFINAYEGILSATINMKLVFTDPLNGAIGITRYAQYVRIIEALALSLGDYFSKNNVSFGEQDPAYGLFVTQ